MTEFRKVYLIVLEGQGDTDIRIVNEPTWTWITEDTGEDEQPIPEWGTGLTDMSDEPTMEPTSGSADNDKALLCSAVASFDSIKALHAYVKANKMDIVDEYHGCIY